MSNLNLTETRKQELNNIINEMKDTNRYQYKANNPILFLEPTTHTDRTFNRFGYINVTDEEMELYSKNSFLAYIGGLKGYQIERTVEASVECLMLLESGEITPEVIAKIVIASEIYSEATSAGRDVILCDEHREVFDRNFKRYLTKEEKQEISERMLTHSSETPRDLVVVLNICADKEGLYVSSYPAYKTREEKTLEGNCIDMVPYLKLLETNKIEKDTNTALEWLVDKQQEPISFSDLVVLAEVAIEYANQTFKVKPKLKLKQCNKQFAEEVYKFLGFILLDEFDSIYHDNEFMLKHRNPIHKELWNRI